MDWIKKYRFRIYGILLILGLIFIFFLGKEFNVDKETRYRKFVNNGVEYFRKGLDVSGGTRLIFKISYNKYEQIYTNTNELSAIKQNVEEIILKNIDNRISSLGVSDYNAYSQILNNQEYIVVEIGGISNLEQAKNTIGKTVELEFKLPNNNPGTEEEKIARKEIAIDLKLDIEELGGEIEKFASNRESENISYYHLQNVDKDGLPDLFKNKPELLEQAKIGEIFPDLIEGKFITISQPDYSGNIVETDLEGFTFFRLLEQKELEKTNPINTSLSGINIGNLTINNDNDGINIETKDESVTTGEMQTVYDIEIVFIQDRESWQTAVTDKGEILNGAYFELARADSSQTGEPVVMIQFNGKGDEIFCDISSENIGEQMAIFIGGQLITAPVIQTKICGGGAQISGNYTPKEVKETVDNLNQGALPAPLILMQEEKVSPTLGSNALTSALIAAAIGILAIFLLMVMLYGLRNGLTTLGVLVSFLIILGLFMKLSDYALSLSGIAAIILSIGMAVDANILIFERVKEEIQDGKSLKSAIDVGYERSRPAIRDGNISTFIIALLLFMFGSNIFKGFGSMLMVTTLLTLLVNAPMTKELLKIILKDK